MIPWWGWLSIWGGLVLALLAMLALFAVGLFRKGIRVLDDLGELAGRLELLEVDETPLTRQPLAVLADPRDIRAREDARRGYRARRRSDRHARRMARARAIVTVNAASARWPSEWYR